MLQVLCGRPSGTRGRRTSSSDTVADDTWFGGYGLGRTNALVHGTVDVSLMGSATSKRPRRVATGSPGAGAFQFAAVQVGRDTVALLLARLHRVFPNLAVRPVHALTLGFLLACRGSLPNLDLDPQQPTVLATVHLYVTSRAHEHHKGCGIAIAVGFCTARLACTLRDCSGGSLPEPVWRTVRGAATAILTAAGTRDYYGYVRGAKEFCSHIKVPDVPEEVLLMHHGDVMSGFVMASAAGSAVTTAAALDDFVAGGAAPGGGVMGSRVFSADAAAGADTSPPHARRGVAPAPCGGAGPSRATAVLDAPRDGAAARGSPLRVGPPDLVHTDVRDGPSPNEEAEGACGSATPGAAPARPAVMAGATGVVVKREEHQVTRAGPPAPTEIIVVISSDDEVEVGPVVAADMQHGVAQPVAEHPPLAAPHDVAVQAVAPDESMHPMAHVPAAVELAAAVLHGPQPVLAAAAAADVDADSPPLSDITASQEGIVIDTYKYDVDGLPPATRAAIKTVNAEV